MKVLSDSSPLITLAKTGNLELLRALYSSVTVTPEVFEESVVSAEGLAGASVIAAAAWIQVQSLRRPAELSDAPARFGIGIGECSLILLGREIKADPLLIDDMKARRVAREAGLTVLGCVGVLYDAWTMHLLPDLTAAYRSLLASEPGLTEGCWRGFFNGWGYRSFD